MSPTLVEGLAGLPLAVAVAAQAALLAGARLADAAPSGLRLWLEDVPEPYGPLLEQVGFKPTGVPGHFMLLDGDGVLHVDPAHGDDADLGTARRPIRTLAKALERLDGAQFTTVQIPAGVYSVDWAGQVARLSVARSGADAVLPVPPRPAPPALPDLDLSAWLERKGENRAARRKGLRPKGRRR